MFEDFKTNFHKHVAVSKKESKRSYYTLRTDWGFDAEQLLRKKRAPRMDTYFNYCNGTNNCVIEVLITCLKDKINVPRLITFINKTFNTNYTNH
jgi:hypothetical protein